MVMDSQFIFEQIDTRIALEAWKQSRQASIFTHPEVAELLSESVKWFAIRKGHQLRAVWPVAFDRQNNVVYPPFSYYFGPLWVDTLYNRRATALFKEGLIIYELFSSKLIDLYGEIKAELHHSLTDTRAFLWRNWGIAEQPKFQVEPRYTALIPDLNCKSENDLMSAYRPVRRRELRKIANQDHFQVRNSVSTQDLVEIYSETFARQHLSVPAATFEIFSKFNELVERGFGHITAMLNRKSSTVESLVLTLDACGVANVVLMLTRQTSRDSGLAQYTVHQSILEAQGRGRFVFDFNGANSPTRADDKHSYGANEQLYFSLSYQEDRSKC